MLVLRANHHSYGVKSYPSTSCDFVGSLSFLHMLYVYVICYMYMLYVYVYVNVIYICYMYMLYVYVICLCYMLWVGAGTEMRTQYLLAH